MTKLLAEQKKTRFLSRKQQDAYIKKGFHVELITPDWDSRITLETANKYRGQGRSAFAIETGTRVKGFHSFYVLVK